MIAGVNDILRRRDSVHSEPNALKDAYVNDFCRGIVHDWDTLILIDANRLAFVLVVLPFQVRQPYYQDNCLHKNFLVDKELVLISVGPLLAKFQA